MLQIANLDARGDVCSLHEDYGWPALQNAEMPKEAKETNHLKAWREFRRLTQEQLAEAVGTSAGVISLLESGERGLSPKWLRKLAPALQTTPGHLLDHDPNTVQTSILDIWNNVPEEAKPQALDILKTFQRRA